LQDAESNARPVVGNATCGVLLYGPAPTSKEPAVLGIDQATNVKVSSKAKCRREEGREIGQIEA
jgi:hypothetical protein